VRWEEVEYVGIERTPNMMTSADATVISAVMQDDEPATVSRRNGRPCDPGSCVRCLSLNGENEIKPIFRVAWGDGEAIRLVLCERFAQTDPPAKRLWRWSWRPCHEPRASNPSAPRSRRIHPQFQERQPAAFLNSI
jgi:hypothetical protein